MIIKAKKVLCGSSESDFSGGLKIIDGAIQSISGDEITGEGDEIADYSDLTIAPLFCDYHLHFTEKSWSSAKKIDQQLLCHGIGTVYEGGDKGAFGLTVREKRNGIFISPDSPSTTKITPSLNPSPHQSRGLKPGRETFYPSPLGPTVGAQAGEGWVRGIFRAYPEIRTSGYALYKAGGYGSVIGRGVSTIPEAYTAIDELTASGIDYLKLIHSGVYEPDSGRISAGGFCAEEIRQIVDYTQEKGLEVYCHANGDRAVREAVDAGVSAIIHGLGICDETLAAMAERKVSFIPTVFAFKSLSKIALTEEGRNNIEREVALHLAKVRKAFDLGVTIRPGSDSGPAFLPYGSSFIEELRMFDRAGILFEDVIRSATNSTLQAGSPVNFVILDGLSVKAVVINGRFLNV